MVRCNVAYSMILTGGEIRTRPVGWLATSAVPAKAHVHGNTSAYGVRSRTRDRVTERFEWGRQTIRGRQRVDALGPISFMLLGNRTRTGDKEGL